MKNIASILALILLTGCQGYKVENGKWSFVQWNEGMGRMVLPVNGADQESFKPVNRDYAKDSKHVYLWDGVVEGADPNTFIFLGKDYGKDNQKVFLRGKEIKGADPNTFKIIDAGLGRDKNDFYHLTFALGVIDPDSFAIINDAWAKDAKAYYAFSGFIKYIGKVDCDYATMKILKHSYALDKNRAYYEGIPIEDVDVKTFQEINEVSAKDCYRNYSLARPGTIANFYKNSAPPKPSP